MRQTFIGRLPFMVDPCKTERYQQENHQRERCMKSFRS